MHEVPLRRVKHFPKPSLNPNAEASDPLDRRGLLDLPISLPSIPILDPLVTLLVGGPQPTPTPGNNNPNPTPTPGNNNPNPTPPSVPILDPLVTLLLGGPQPTPTPVNNNPDPTPPPQKSPPQPTPIHIPDLVNGNGSGNGGGDNKPVPPNPGGGNTGVPNPNPNIPPIPNPNPPNSNPNPPPNSNPNPPPSSNPNLPPNPNSKAPPNPNPKAPPNPNSNTPPNPNPNPPPDPNPSIPPNTPSPTSNPDSPDSKVSNSSNPSPTSGLPPFQPSGIAQNDSVHLAKPDPQNPNPDDPEDSPGGLNGSGNVVFTTVSGVKSEVTGLPHLSSGDGPTSETGNGLVNGDGDGSGDGTNSSGGRRLGTGIIAAIVVFGVLVLALLLFLLRKRVKRRRTVQRTRWLSSDEKGPRTTLRSSFGDLRASTFGYQPDDGNDTSSTKSNSGPFSDKMAVPTPASENPFDPRVAEVTHPEITPPAIAVHSTGRRSSRNSQFSIGSSESGGTDSSEAQWVEIHHGVGYLDNISPTDQFRLPSPISVRPFTPTESWLFPKPPNSRVTSIVMSRESRGSLVPDPFADPVPQPSYSGFPPVEMVMRTFEPEAGDELAVEIGDEVSVLRVFNDGWGRVKVLKRNGSAEGVQGLEGLIPIDCLKPAGNKEDKNLEYTREINVFDVDTLGLAL